MSWNGLIGLAAAAALLLFSAPGIAKDKGRQIDVPARQDRGERANVRHARIALYYSPVGGVLRSKGVDKVTSPHPGIYCIKPTRNLDTSKFIASVSVDWFESDGADVMAQWAGLAVNCPDIYKWFQVRTYELDLRDGSYPNPSDRVGFTFIVP
ncbi:hypothetical protein [Microbaculum marinum]|uniref:Uncharacterized protein n=1 Tax=Microbaculum marinum TaxID=1764581 RepID=A0AAW9RM35_9HYPH